MFCRHRQHVKNVDVVLKLVMSHRCGEHLWRPECRVFSHRVVGVVAMQCDLWEGGEGQAEVLHEVRECKLLQQEDGRDWDVCGWYTRLYESVYVPQHHRYENITCTKSQHHRYEDITSTKSQHHRYEYLTVWKHSCFLNITITNSDSSKTFIFIFRARSWTLQYRHCKYDLWKKYVTRENLYTFD